VPIECVTPVCGVNDDASGGGCDGLFAVLATLAEASGDCGDELGQAGRLLEVLGAVADGRDPRGIRHSMASMLATAVAAVACGETSVTAIAQWAKLAQDNNQALLGALGTRRDPATGRYQAPHKDTFDRAFAAVDAQSLDDVSGEWMLARLAETRRQAPTAPSAPDATAEPAEPAADPPMRPGFAVDGKALKSTIGPDGKIVHLLSAFDHQVGVTFAQRQVAEKSNEIPGFRPLIEGLDLRGWVATMDALHTQRGHVRFCHDHDIDVIMIAKDNQPNLFTSLDAINWPDVPVSHRTEERGHGRHEIRTIQITHAPPDLRLEHMSQAFLVERTTFRPVRKNGKTTRVETAVAVLGVTTLTPANSTPAHVATHIRGHWGIENRSHYVRDVTYREDASRVGRANKPRVMATLRNIAISLIRLAGHTTIAPTTRTLRYSPDQLTTVLGLRLQPNNGQ
jgi:predicted transposase YbfD/YdcC